LGKVFVLFEVTLVTGADAAAVLGSQIFVADVSVVEVPGAGAGISGNEPSCRACSLSDVPISATSPNRTTEP